MALELPKLASMPRFACNLRAATRVCPLALSAPSGLLDPERIIESSGRTERAPRMSVTPAPPRPGRKEMEDSAPPLLPSADRTAAQKYHSVYPGIVHDDATTTFPPD